MFVVALVLLAIAIALPFYQVYIPPWGGLGGGVRRDVFGYEEPILLFSYSAFGLFALLYIEKILLAKRKTAYDFNAPLAYATLLLGLPALIMLALTHPEYVGGGMRIPESSGVLFMILMPGGYVYLAGCALLIASRIVPLMVPKKSAPASERIAGWLKRNRVGASTTALLLTAISSILLTYIGSGTVDSVTDYGFGITTLFLFDVSRRFIYLAQYGDLFLLLVILAAIAVNIVLYSRYRVRLRK